MCDRTPIPLAPKAIGLNDSEFKTISCWSFADAYVGRLLREDVPFRMRFKNGRMWAYRDPDGQLVGFGSLDFCNDYSRYTDGLTHPYIPLLAANPGIKSRGYGTSILQHLVTEAALYSKWFRYNGILFLDVYSSNDRAIQLYERCQFEKIHDEPLLDPEEDNKPYFIMARRVAIASE